MVILFVTGQVRSGDGAIAAIKTVDDAWRRVSLLQAFKRLGAHADASNGNAARETQMILEQSTNTIASERARDRTGSTKMFEATRLRQTRSKAITINYDYQDFTLTSRPSSLAFRFRTAGFPSAFQVRRWCLSDITEHVAGPENSTRLV